LKYVHAITLSFLFAGTPVFAANSDCLFDRAEQIKTLKDIASTHARAIVDEEKQTVSWTEKGNRVLTARHGGCQHLSFAITSIEPRRSASSEAAVLRAAIAMAKTFGDETGSQADNLAQAIRDKSYTKESRAAGTVYRLLQGTSNETSIAQELSDGHEQIVVQWALDL
jgi:hypothetical protein